MTRPRFADPARQRLFETCRRLGADPASEFYYNGEPKRLAAHRAAYWSGRAGMPRPPGVGPESLSYACYAAGVADRRVDVAQGNAMPRWRLAGNYWRLEAAWKPRPG